MTQWAKFLQQKEDVTWLSEKPIWIIMHVSHHCKRCDRWAFFSTLQLRELLSWLGQELQQDPWWVDPLSWLLQMQQSNLISLRVQTQQSIRDQWFNVGNFAYNYAMFASDPDVEALMKLTKLNGVTPLAG
jgi:hypothetical protein